MLDALRSLIKPFLALLTIIKDTKGTLNLLVIAFVITIASSFAAVAAYLNVAHDQDKLISSYSLGEPEQWNAVLQDIDESGKSTISTERLTLIYSGKYVVGWAEDNSAKDDDGKPYRWRVSGYKAAGYLVLSYLTDKPDPHGIGVYSFKEYGRDYVGHWMGVPWRGAERVKCPGLLIKGSIDIEKVKREWPQLKQTCVAADS